MAGIEALKAGCKLREELLLKTSEVSRLQGVLSQAHGEGCDAEAALNSQLLASANRVSELEKELLELLELSRRLKDASKEASQEVRQVTEERETAMKEAGLAYEEQEKAVKEAAIANAELEKVVKETALAYQEQEKAVKEVATLREKVID